MGNTKIKNKLRSLSAAISALIVAASAISGVFSSATTDDNITFSALPTYQTDAIEIDGEAEQAWQNAFSVKMNKLNGSDVNAVIKTLYGNESCLGNEENKTLYVLIEVNNNQTELDLDNSSVYLSTDIYGYNSGEAPVLKGTVGITPTGMISSSGYIKAETDNPERNVVVAATEDFDSWTAEFAIELPNANSENNYFKRGALDGFGYCTGIGLSAIVKDGSAEPNNDGIVAGWGADSFDTLNDASSTALISYYGELCDGETVLAFAEDVISNPSLNPIFVFFNFEARLDDTAEEFVYLCKKENCNYKGNPITGLYMIDSTSEDLSNDMIFHTGLDYGGCKYQLLSGYTRHITVIDCIQDDNWGYSDYEGICLCYTTDANAGDPIKALYCFEKSGNRQPNQNDFPENVTPVKTVVSNSNLIFTHIEDGFLCAVRDVTYGGENINFGSVFANNPTLSAIVIGGCVIAVSAIVTVLIVAVRKNKKAV